MIYCLLGMTNSGKTTIMNELSERLNIPKIQTFTSRPRREGESSDAYNFVTPEFFKEHKDEFLETKEYKVASGDIWYYGTYKESIDITKDQFIILDVSGYEALIKEYGEDNVVTFYIKSDIDILKKRALERGDDPKEIKRRLHNDLGKFLGFEREHECYRITNNSKLEYSVDIIESIIKGLQKYR